MPNLRKANRTIHRWSSPPWLLAVIASVIFTAAGGSESSPLFVLLGIIIVGSLLILVVTGSAMWIQHYQTRLRRKRSSARSYQHADESRA
jgi:hypothetical protein